MIPLKIETLLKGRVVEHDRVEYKIGWNPNDIIHSICAFANDYDNTNGGYIVIGVKEENGMPVFPLEGVPKEDLDSIQQEFLQVVIWFLVKERLPLQQDTVKKQQEILMLGSEILLMKNQPTILWLPSKNYKFGSKPMQKQKLSNI
jgi:ATP-dependent DNA helicase RecG